MAVPSGAARSFGQNQLAKFGVLQSVAGAIVLNDHGLFPLEQFAALDGCQGRLHQSLILVFPMRAGRFWHEIRRHIANHLVFGFGDETNFLDTGLLSRRHGLGHTLVTHGLVAPDVQIRLWVFGGLGLQ